MQPFTVKHVIVVVIGSASYLIGTWFWRVPNTLIDIIIRSGVVASFYGLFTYLFKISDDINEKVNNTLKKLGRIVK